MMREVLTRQARSEFKYVAPKPWCKAMSQAAAVTIVNHNSESKEQYKVKIGLCNVETTYLRATFILPTLAPQDRFANYDVEADPLLNQFHVTHRPRFFLDSWGLHPKVYGLPRPLRQQPSVSAAVIETIDTGLATDTGRNTVGLQANERDEQDEQDDNATCAREEPVMNEPVAESSAERDPAVVIPVVEIPVVGQAVEDEPVAKEPMTDDILAVKNDNQTISQADSRSNKAITIDTKLAQSYDHPSLSSSPEDKRSASSSPTAKSPAASTPEKKGQVSGSCTPPTSAGSTPEKGKTEKQIAKEAEKNFEPPSNIQSQAFENQECLAEATNLDNDKFSLSSVAVEPALIDQAVEVPTNSALDAVTNKAEEVSDSSRYSMVGSALSFAQEKFSFSLDPKPKNAVPIKQDAKTCSAKIPKPQTKVEPSKPQTLASSLMDQSNSGPSTHAATEGKGSKKGNKKKQKKAAKKAKKASKEEDFGSNGPSQHEDQPEPSATAPAANFSSVFLRDDKAVSDKPQGSAASSSTSSSPSPREKGSDSGTPPLAISGGERSMSDKSPTPAEDSKQNLPAPLPTEGKVAKKGKAKKKNANRKAKRAIMFAAMDDKELERQIERARLVEASVDDVSTSDVPAVDATSELDDKKTEVHEEISKEAMAEDMKQESDISKAPIAENLQGDFHQCGETHTLTTSGEDQGCENLEDPQVIDTSTVKLENQILIVAPEMQNPPDATTSEERNHEEDKTTCGGSTIEIASELGHSKALIADKEHCIVKTIAKSPSHIISKAIALVQTCTALTKNCSTSQVIQAQRLFIPRCLLVPRISSRPIWKTRALVMHSKGQTGEGHGKSKKIDTLNIKKAKVDCKNVPRITPTQDLSGSVVPTTQGRLTKDNNHLDVSIRIVTYSSNRLLTDKPWTVCEAGRNLEIPTESSTGRGSTEASEKDTPELPINTAVPLSAPRKTYNPHSFLLPGVASLIIKKMNATALRNSSGFQLKGEAPEKATSGPLAGDYQSARSGTLQQDVEESRLKGKMVEQSLLEDVDEPVLKEKIGKTPLREDAKQHPHTSRDDEVSMVSPQEIYNPQCLLVQGETSWIIEKINATASGDFDESKLKKQTVEPVVEENIDTNGLSFLDASTTLEMIDESELKGNTVEPASNEDSDPDQPSSLDTIATSPPFPSASPPTTTPDIVENNIPTSHDTLKTTTVTQQPPTTTSPEASAHQTILAKSVKKPDITSALEAIDIVQAATAVQEEPEDKCLLLQFILVLVVRLVCLLFQ
jgi:hypothetical protein